jgi:hypothetical protein
LHRNDVQAVGTCLSNPVKRRLAAGAFQTFGLKHLFHDTQMGRQRGAGFVRIASAPRLATVQHLFLVLQPLKLSLESGLRQFDILETQGQLAWRQLLRSFAELQRPQLIIVLLQLADQRLKPNDKGPEVLDFRA